MGLEEKRKAKMLQDEVIPKVSKAIKEITAKDIPIEVIWQGINHEIDRMINVERTLEELPEVFKNICIDDIGRDAVKESIHKIIIKHSEQENDIFLRNNAVEIVNYYWQSSYWDESSIRTRLEKAL